MIGKTEKVGFWWLLNFTDWLLYENWKLLGEKESLE
jgi:hypothetical protein